MTRRFRQHYTRQQANALLPSIREWLTQLVDLRDRLTRFEERIGVLLAEGRDVGGESVHGWLRTMVDFRGIALEFQQREIQIKDLDRGLIDFPAVMQNREVFLCWELGEEEVEFWHDLDTGYAGRERLED